MKERNPTVTNFEVLSTNNFSEKGNTIYQDYKTHLFFL